MKNMTYEQITTRLCKLENLSIVETKDDIYILKFEDDSIYELTPLYYENDFYWYSLPIGFYIIESEYKSYISDK